MANDVKMLQLLQRISASQEDMRAELRSVREDVAQLKAAQ